MAEPIQVEVSGSGDGGKRPEARRRPIVIPPERAGLKLVLSAVGALIASAIAYYIMLPPLNFKSKEFYMFLAIPFVAFIVLVFMFTQAGSKPEYVPYVRKATSIPVLLILVGALFFGAAFAISSPFFQAKRYSEMMLVEEDKTFDHYLAEVDFSAIPKLDEEAATVVANRSLSALAKYVSQFTVGTTSFQINYKQKPVRVVPLGYASLIKWFTNTKEGLPGYVIVDMANEVSEFIELENRIRYSDNEHFGKLLKRHLRFQYPTYMFGDMNFEINDAGHPYWVVARMDKTIGLLGGEDVVGIILVDAVTGECTKYDMDAVRTQANLQWIDRVYTAELLTTQFNYYGKFRDGFWNSLLGQQGVIAATDGYNYIAKEDDVFKYTGVGSVTADQSITGFTIINQRTKEAHFYSVSGATEKSAETAAAGLVQDKGWTTTFPLLLNVAGQPTYFLSFKDASNVVQGYAMLHVSQINKIKVWSETIAGVKNLYTAALDAEGIESPDIANDSDDGSTPEAPVEPVVKTAQGTIADIRTAVINGNTTYYILLEGTEVYFMITASKQPDVVLLNKGDNAEVSFSPAAGGGMIQADKIVKKAADVPAEPVEPAA